jgi:uncharacterized protein YjbJ (UPF0337 family)
MNWNAVETRWSHLKSDLKAHWARLTDEDIERLGAKREKLVGKLVERYGILKEDAEKQVDEWTRKVASTLADMKGKFNRSRD